MVVCPQQWCSSNSLGPEEACGAGTKDGSAVTFIDHLPGAGRSAVATLETNVDR